MRTIFTSIIILLLLVFGTNPLISQTDNTFKNHRKGDISIGVNFDAIYNSKYKSLWGKRNLDVTYHLTDKWAVGAKLGLAGGRNELHINASLYGRRYLLDLGKRKRASWFVQGELFYEREKDNSIMISNEDGTFTNYISNNIGFKVGTGFDIALNKNLFLTSMISVENTPYVSNHFTSQPFSFSNSNNLNISVGIKWRIGRIKKEKKPTQSF